MTQPPPGPYQPPDPPPFQRQPPAPQPPPGYQPPPAYAQQPVQPPHPVQPAQPGYPPGAVPPAWGPPPPAGPTVMTHLTRAIDWNVGQIDVTPSERIALDAAGVEPRLHGLFAWRRSTLLVALPLLVLSVLLSIIEAADIETEGFNAFGKLWLYLPTIGLIFVPIGVVKVIQTWTEMWRSAKFLIVCWLLSIGFPLFAALIPLDMVIDIDGMRAEQELFGGDVAAFDAQVLLARLLQAITFAMILLPVVLSIPGGVLRGASRIKSLFPASSLPGWFLVAVAPFYSLFTVVVFVLIVQIAGNALLMLAVAILAFSPWLFVIYRGVYGRPLSIAEARTELARASRLGGWLLIAALTLLCIFAATAKVSGFPVVGSGDEAVFSYVQVLRTVGEVISRGLVTTVVFSSIFLGMVFAEWRAAGSMSGELRREHDDQMSALTRFFQRSGPAGGL